MEHLTTFFSPLLLALGSKVYGKGFKPWDLGTIGARCTLWVGSQWRTTWRRRNQAYQAGHAAIALSTNSLEAVFVFLFTTIVMSASRAALSLIESAIKKHNVVVFSKTTCPFSVLAKRILSEAGVEEMKVYEIEQRQDGAEIQVRMWKVNHLRDKMKMVMKIYIIMVCR